MLDSIKKSVKCRVPVQGRGPIAFGAEWVKIGLGGIVMKVLLETHTFTEFIEIRSNLRPVDVARSRAKGKAPSKQLVLVLRKRDRA